VLVEHFPWLSGRPILIAGAVLVAVQAVAAFFAN
jgi:hypothetical protein